MPKEPYHPNCCDVCKQVFDKYISVYGYDCGKPDLGGCCLLLADEISKLNGGQVVAGWLRAVTGWKRAHWWVETPDGVVHDPLGDFYKGEPGFYRQWEHKDQATFRSILPNFEQWRVK